MANWQDRIVGERMQVDDEFSSRVASSSFSRQQWGLVMTAVEFEIENPGDEDAARLVADTSNLEHVMEEMDNVEQQMGAMGGGQPGAESSGGLFDSVLHVLGLDDGDDGPSDEAREREAASLAQEYADALQAKLEENGRWDEVREAAAA